jgi:hypothetical protein
VSRLTHHAYIVKRLNDIYLTIADIEAELTIMNRSHVCLKNCKLDQSMLYTMEGRATDIANQLHDLRFAQMDCLDCVPE